MSDRPFYETSYKTIVETAQANAEAVSTPVDYTCEKCGIEIEIGMWGTCKGDPNDHGVGVKHYGFEPYIDEHIRANGTDFGLNLSGEKVFGTRISSRDDRRIIMKQDGLESGGKGTNKHRRSSKTDHDALAERIVREASQEWRNKGR